MSQGLVRRLDEERRLITRNSALAALLARASANSNNYDNNDNDNDNNTITNNSNNDNNNTTNHNDNNSRRCWRGPQRVGLLRVSAVKPPLVKLLWPPRDRC